MDFSTQAPMVHRRPPSGHLDPGLLQWLVQVADPLRQRLARQWAVTAQRVAGGSRHFAGVLKGWLIIGVTNGYHLRLQGLENVHFFGENVEQNQITELRLRRCDWQRWLYNLLLASSRAREIETKAQRHRYQQYMQDQHDQPYIWRENTKQRQKCP